MAAETEISWTDSTMNFWIGCTKIAPACDHCYAADLDKRWGGDHWGNVPRRRTSAQNWNEPLRWQRRAPEFRALHGRRRRVFVSSMSDFYDNQIDPQWRADAWEVIRACPDLDWLILTKRPQNIRKMLPAFWDEIRGTIWSGTTVEDIPRAEQNIPHLLEIDSRYRFISGEPLLGPLHLRSILFDVTVGVTTWLDALSGETFFFDARTGLRMTKKMPHKLDWVIVGGESGHGARPMHPLWIDNIQQDCADTGTAFHWKQWGNHVPAAPDEPGAFLVMPWGEGNEPPSWWNGGPPPAYVKRVKSKVSGNIRGVDYKEFPSEAR